MIKNILIPTDFSKNARDAFNYAISLALKTRASITLYHAWSSPMLDPGLSFKQERAAMGADRRKKERRLKSWCDKAKEQGVKAVSFIMNDNIGVRGIRAQVNNGHYDLVVMGTKGASGIRAVLLGSNTAAMITSSNIPVLAIPQRAKYNGLKKLLAAVDYQDTDTASMAYIEKLTGIFRSFVTAIHVTGPDFTDDFEQYMLKEFSKKMKRKFPDMKLEYKLLRKDDIIEGLNEAIRQEQPDALVMVAEKRSWIGKLFWGNLAEKMSFCTKVPLLTIPAEDKD
jgi:nucleotide-binding universal stress UspA family protein